MDKKRIIVPFLSLGIFLLVFAFVAAVPSIQLHFMDGHYIHEGIDKYNYALSSVGLCNYLTLRENDCTDPKKGKVSFAEEYPYSSAFFRFEEDYKGGFAKETVVLSLYYEEKTSYSDAIKDISTKPGFSSEIEFAYGDYIFKLNKTEELSAIEHANAEGLPESAKSRTMTDYLLNSDNPYIHWIQLVGCSEPRQEIVFIGFYYLKQWRNGFWSFDESYYSFSGWDVLLQDEFSFYSFV